MACGYLPSHGALSIPINRGPEDRRDAEAGLVLIGLVALVDPPRARGFPDAVAHAHQAGIRIHVVTGDYGPTATEITRQALIAPFPVIVWGADELARWARRRHHSQTRIAAVATT